MYPWMLPKSSAATHLPGSRSQRKRRGVCLDDDISGATDGYEAVLRLFSESITAPSVDSSRATPDISFAPTQSLRVSGTLAPLTATTHSDVEVDAELSSVGKKMKGNTRRHPSSTNTRGAKGKDQEATVDSPSRSPPPPPRLAVFEVLASCNDFVVRPSLCQRRPAPGASAVGDPCPSPASSLPRPSDDYSHETIDRDLDRRGDAASSMIDRVVGLGVFPAPHSRAERGTSGCDSSPRGRQLLFLEPPVVRFEEGSRGPKGTSVSAVQERVYERLAEADRRQVLALTDVHDLVAKNPNLYGPPPPSSKDVKDVGRRARRRASGSPPPLPPPAPFGVFLTNAIPLGDVGGGGGDDDDDDDEMMETDADHHDEATGQAGSKTKGASTSGDSASETFDASDNSNLSASQEEESSPQRDWRSRRTQNDEEVIAQPLKRSALFPLTARLNHACVPTAAWFWDDECGIQIVAALPSALTVDENRRHFPFAHGAAARPTGSDEEHPNDHPGPSRPTAAAATPCGEYVASYVDELDRACLDVDRRRALLKESFGFDCCCQRCVWELQNESSRGGKCHEAPNVANPFRQLHRLRARWRQCLAAADAGVQQCFSSEERLDAAAGRDLASSSSNDDPLIRGSLAAMGASHDDDDDRSANDIDHRGDLWIKTVRAVTMEFQRFTAAHHRHRAAQRRRRCSTQEACGLLSTLRQLASMLTASVSPFCGAASSPTAASDNVTRAALPNHEEGGGDPHGVAWSLQRAVWRQVGGVKMAATTSIPDVAGRTAGGEKGEDRNEEEEATEAGLQHPPPPFPSYAAHLSIVDTIGRCLYAMSWFMLLLWSARGIRQPCGRHDDDDDDNGDDDDDHNRSNKNAALVATTFAAVIRIAHQWHACILRPGWLALLGTAEHILAPWRHHLNGKTSTVVTPRPRLERASAHQAEDDDLVVRPPAMLNPALQLMKGARSSTATFTSLPSRIVAQRSACLQQWLDALVVDDSAIGRAFSKRHDAVVVPFGRVPNERST